MAKVDALPALAVFWGVRGSLDFYQWRGINVVRRWPRYGPSSQTQATKLAQGAFAYVHSQTSILPANVVESWQWLASQSNLTWRDWMARAYVGGTLAAPGESWP